MQMFPPHVSSSTFIPPPSHCLCGSWFFLLTGHTTEKSYNWSPSISYSEKLALDFLFWWIWVCWIIEVNAVNAVFFSVNYEPQCERSKNRQLWKLCFRWVSVVIISSSLVTGCTCVCLSLYVRARLWACVYMTVDLEGKWRRAQRRDEGCRQCCRGRETEKRGRDRKTTEN